MTLYKTIFCANDQTETKHELRATQSGEVEATCEVCGRFIKFPANMKPQELEAKLGEHKASNEGQVTQDSINQALEAIADKPSDSE